MAAGRGILLRYIRRVVQPAEPDEASDAALLRRFLSARDESAFTALVERHGPLVLHVCRRVLGDIHDAEDACQAVFLVLARKAASVHPREALAAWLHGVARRVALKARSARARRFRTDYLPAPLSADSRPDPLAEISGRELLTIIDEELQRLADVYRLPVILCCLEGRSLEEVARQLGWTVGSVKGRLERGRARLHDRLLRRGLTLPAALAAVEASRGPASAAAVAVSALSVSATAAALAADTLRGMAWTRWKLAVALVVLMSLLVGGFALRSSPPPHVRSSVPPTDQTALVGNQVRAGPDEDHARIEVSGRVLDPGGKPFSGAILYIGYSTHRYVQDLHCRQRADRPRATSAADGSFHFAFTRSELDAKWLDDSRPAVIAVAAGHGPDWAEIGASGTVGEISLRLVEDFPVDGRILNPNNKPVAGAEVLVLDISKDSEQGVTRFLRGDNAPWYPRTWRGPLPGQPPGVTTGADGRFRLTGVGRDRIVRLAFEGSTIPRGFLTVAARPSPAIPYAGGIFATTFDYVAPPSRSFRGVVRDKTTGQPVPGVKMSVYQSTFTTLTDGDGLFEILGCPKGLGYLAMAQPQADQPYFAASACVKEQATTDPLTVDFELVRGIVLSGRVTDLSTHMPPRTAVVEYYPLFPNPHSSRITYGAQSIPGTMAASSAVIGPDGSYRLVVLPGPGVVCVSASPRNSYAVAGIDDRQLANTFPEGTSPSDRKRLCTASGGARHEVLWVNHYNAVSLIRPDEKQQALALDLMVQPAHTVQGLVLGPDGLPLTGVEVVGLSALPDEEMLESASFTVVGLNPRCNRQVTFRHRQKKSLGKLLVLRGDETGPLTVQLDAYGSILGRIVDKRGNPVPGITLYFYSSGGRPSEPAEADREGRFRVALLPGQKYSLLLSTSRRLLRDAGQIEVESGGSKDLGDLPISD
jgi:RNA polymerase sigma factor (sigma-70 family)